jgi:DNA-binding response OmpR family regulator
MRENHKKVLIVDKDADSRELLAALLSLQKYEALSASTIKESLALIKNFNFDLILLGWYFEDGTGVELCRLIRVFDQLTPIFFCSANAYQSDIKKALQAGAQRYFIKPIDTRALMHSIMHQLYQGRV